MYVISYSQSFEYSCFKDYKTTTSYIENDLNSIFNIKYPMTKLSKTYGGIVRLSPESSIIRWTASYFCAKRNEIAVQRMIEEKRCFRWTGLIEDLFIR